MQRNVSLSENAATANAIYFDVSGYSAGYSSDLFRLTSDGTVTQVSAADVIVSDYIVFDGSGAAVFIGQSEAGRHLYRVDAAGTVTDIGETLLQYLDDDFSLAGASYFEGSEGDGSKLYRLDQAGNYSQVGTLTSVSDAVITGAGAFLVANDETGRHLFKIDAAGNLSQALDGISNYIGDFTEINGTTYAAISDENYNPQTLCDRCQRIGDAC